MVHLDNGFDQDLYDFNLGVLKDNGAKWDMIGMSLYPYWALDGGFRDDEDQTITDCIANIRHVSEKFDCDVMIVETGFYVDENDPERLHRRRTSDSHNGCLLRLVRVVGISAFKDHRPESSLMTFRGVSCYFPSCKVTEHLHRQTYEY